MRWRRGTTGGEQGGDHGGRPEAGDDDRRSPLDPVTGADADADADDADATPGGSNTPAGLGASTPAPELDVPVDLGIVDEADLRRAIRRAVARALAEDLGDRGDLTSLATVPPGLAGDAVVRARGDGVLSGTRALAAVYEQLDSRVTVELLANDGDRISAGDVVARVRGPLRSVLTGERSALNFLCHLSGIATRTRAFVEAVADLPCAVRDTRKTTPGLRLLDKQAVRDGGGHSHRIGLHDALLVKDNHIAAAGSLTDAVEAARSRGHGRHIQVEVANLGELDEALQLGVTDVLLDNFTVDDIRQAVARTRGRARLEASGTISLDDVRAHAQAGVDRVAVGALTHSAPWLDLGLDVEPVTAPVADVPVSSIWHDEDDTILEPDPTSGLEADLVADDDADLDRLLTGPDDSIFDRDDVAGEQPPPDDEPQGDAAESGLDDPGLSGGLFAWRERQSQDRPSGGS